MKESSEEVVCKNCHPEPRLLPLSRALKSCNSGSNSKDSGSHPLLTMQEAEMLKRVQHDNTWGFTLIEILVVVLIIGVLGAIALPQYQRAVLKSRFASLMPIAKSMADSNEAYYLEHGEYADNAQDLPVQGRQNYPDGTELEFGTSTDYSYVLATNQHGTPNNAYVAYQKHSKNFADNTHCEAADDDELATWLCRDALHGTPINTGEIKSLSGDGYTAYVLSGSTTGSSFDRSCEGDTPTEYQACESGCGQVSRTGTCNPHTGEWEFEDFDMSSCPVPLDPQEANCDENYSGKKTRVGQCNADGTAFEYTDWNTNACVPLTWTTASLNALARELCPNEAVCNTFVHTGDGTVGTTKCAYSGSNNAESLTIRSLTYNCHIPNSGWQTCGGKCDYTLYRSDGRLLEEYKCLGSCVNCSSSRDYCGSNEKTTYNLDGGKTVETVDCGTGSFTKRGSYNSQVYCSGVEKYGRQPYVKKTYDANNKVISTKKAECYEVSQSSRTIEGCSTYGYVAGNGATTGKWRIVTTENGKTVTQNCNNGINPQTMECA